MESTVETLYKKYEPLARKYANKVFGYECTAFEYEDILQELKIKIFESIKAYGRRWIKYQEGTATKPVPLQYYLETACANRVRDFARTISIENLHSSIDEMNYDYGTEDNCTVDLSNNEFKVNDIDLLQGLQGVERVAFNLFLRGYTENKIGKVIKQVSGDGNCKKVRTIIDEQRAKLIVEHGEELQKARMVYATYNLDEE